MRKILIVGAHSAIAQACARKFALAGDHLFLVARNQQQIDSMCADLSIRGAKLVKGFQMDANDVASIVPMLTQAQSELGGIDTVLIAHGTLPDQDRCQISTDYAIQEINNNALSVIALLTPIAELFEQQKHGCIAVISSVAGDRGRASNYVYGSAKAMVSTFLSGLRQRLAKSGVVVLTIKPGFVATPMTANLALPAKLTASAETVASDIVRAIKKGQDVLYTHWFWWVIMHIIRAIPERIFKNTKI